MSDSSFVNTVPERHCPSIQRLVSVVLGNDTARESVRFAFTLGPLSWVNFLGTDVGALAEAFVEVLLKRAHQSLDKFAAKTEEIHDLLHFFFQSVFGYADLHRISVSASSKMQRLLYLICAKTVASFDKLDENSSHAQRAQFKCAVFLVAELADAMKDWLPVASWLCGWTKWHAIAFVLELTTGNLLATDSPELSEFRVMQFFEHLLFQIALEAPYNAFTTPTIFHCDDEETDGGEDTDDGDDADQTVEFAVHPAYDLGIAFGWVCRSRLYGNLYKRVTEDKARHFPACFRFAVYYKKVAHPRIVSGCSRPATPPRAASSSTNATPHTSPVEFDAGSCRHKRKRESVCSGGSSVRSLEFVC